MTRDAYHVARVVSVEGLAHCLVRRLERPDPICGVYIESNLEIAVVELFKERDVVGEELLVPAGHLVSRHRTLGHACVCSRVASPAGAEISRHIDKMPDPISRDSRGFLSHGTHQSMSSTPTDNGIDSFLNLSIKSRYSCAEYASSIVSSNSLAPP